MKKILGTGLLAVTLCLQPVSAMALDWNAIINKATKTVKVVGKAVGKNAFRVVKVGGLLVSSAVAAKRCAENGENATMAIGCGIDKGIEKGKDIIEETVNDTIKTADEVVELFE